MTIQRGGEPHPQYFTRPLIEDPYLLVICRAFDELSSERPVGMGPGRIPRSAIRNFIAEEMDYLDADAAGRMEDTLIMIDSGWLGLQSDGPEPAQSETDPDEDRAHPVEGLLKGIAKKKNASRKRR